MFIELYMTFMPVLAILLAKNGYTEVAAYIAMPAALMWLVFLVDIKRLFRKKAKKD